jgi:multidrug efflux system outer membrane protein
LITGVALALGACTVGPDYRAPVIDLAGRYAHGAATPLPAAAAEPWWRELNDARLNAYVAQGNAANLTLAAALERIRAAEAALGRTGLNAATSGALSSDVTVTGGSSADPDWRANTRFGAAWVLDLFGAQRRGRERALAGFDAAQFDAGVARLALVSEITATYLRARHQQAAAAITRGSIARRGQLLGLVEELRQAGAATLLDVEQARALLKTAEANLPALEAGFEANVFRLATLLDRPAAPLLTEMREGAPQPRPRPVAEPGVPADLLRNRPDVRLAERRLAAAVAAVGVAEAALYPSVTLNGNIGLLQTGQGGTGNSWSFGPALNLPILNRGALQADREVARSEARQAELAWRAAVRVAVQEVQVALSQLHHLRRQVAATEESLVYTGRVLELSRASYRARETTLTEILDAEISLANGRIGLAGALRDQALAWAELQVAAGKGWAAPGLLTGLEQLRPAPRPDPLGLGALLRRVGGAG